MMGIVNNQYFCDLFCYRCDGAFIKTCPIFGWKHSFLSARTFALGVHFKFEDSLVEGIWSKYVIMTPKEYGRTTFAIYEDEREN